MSTPGRDLSLISTPGSRCRRRSSMTTSGSRLPRPTVKSRSLSTQCSLHTGPTQSRLQTRSALAGSDRHAEPAIATAKNDGIVQSHIWTPCRSPNGKRGKSRRGSEKAVPLAMAMLRKIVSRKAMPCCARSCLGTCLVLGTVCWIETLGTVCWIETFSVEATTASTCETNDARCPTCGHE